MSTNKDKIKMLRDSVGSLRDFVFYLELELSDLAFDKHSDVTRLEAIVRQLLLAVEGIKGLNEPK